MERKTGRKKKEEYISLISYIKFYFNGVRFFSCLCLWIKTLQNKDSQLQNQFEDNCIYFLRCFRCLWVWWSLQGRMGQDSLVGIVTGYGLDGPGIESRWGEFYRPWTPTNLLFHGYRVHPGGKAAGAWRWPPTPSSAEVK
jgi:hypothetical protein